MFRDGRFARAQKGPTSAGEKGGKDRTISHCASGEPGEKRKAEVGEASISEKGKKWERVLEARKKEKKKNALLRRLRVMGKRGRGEVWRLNTSAWIKGTSP